MADRELKFVCSPWSDRSMISSLASRCRSDAEYRTNQVNSVYYDTQNWSWADEKAASDYLKTKVRVRWYSEFSDACDDHNLQGSPDNGVVFLEVKRKIGSTRQKLRKKLSMTPRAFLTSASAPQTAAMVRAEVSATAPELDGVDIFPRVLVRYHRRRFVDPVTRSRIAYDCNIRGQAMARSPAERFQVILDQSVLEVKGQALDLPENLRFLNALSVRKAAFSKYYECYCGLMGYTQ